MSLSYTHAHLQGSGTTEVVAVLVAITANQARVLTVDSGKLLPNGPLMPLHRSLQAGVRQWVEEQTQQPLGYIEQLYTFVDTNRRNNEGHALVYVSYLGLVQETDLAALQSQAAWHNWYEYFPWEDHLEGPPSSINELIVPALLNWANSSDEAQQRQRRRQRIGLCWGVDIASANNSGQSGATGPSDSSSSGSGNHSSPSAEDVKADVQVEQEAKVALTTTWVAEHVLLRYEMLYEAGLIPESPDYQPNKLPKSWPQIIGRPMYYDHRRVIATAISRLRAKLEYRPLIFGLMPPAFTLSQLQQSVEALSGVQLHKQNFRRLLEHQDLVEPTGDSSNASRGRPAKLYRFRYDIELQSLLMDSKLSKLK